MYKRIKSKNVMGLKSKCKEYLQYNFYVKILNCNYFMDTDIYSKSIKYGRKSTNHLRIAVNTRKEKIGSGKNAKRASTITAIFCKLERFIIFKKISPQKKNVETFFSFPPSLHTQTHTYTRREWETNHGKEKPF